MIEIAEGKVGAGPQHTPDTHRQAFLDAGIEFEIHDFFRHFLVKQVFTRNGSDLGALQELDGRIPHISLRLVQMSMFFTITGMADL